MNNTVPVKRMTKDGILTTKHVRADPKASKLKSAMPAPKLTAPSQSLRKRAYKGGTKRQQERVSRSYTASIEDPSPQLVASLGIDHDLGVYRFKAGESDMYGMMAFMSTGNTLAFLQARINSSTDALEYLRKNGMEDLIVFNDLPLEAQERRIPIEDYMRETRRQPQEVLDDPLFIDAVEMSGIAALRDFKELPEEVRYGRVRLEDVKTVGATRIKGAVGWDVTHEALQKIADGTAKYTAEDLKFVVETFGQQSNDYMENALVLHEKYGPEVMRSIRFPSWTVLHLGDKLKKEGADDERIKSILCYRDACFKDDATTDFRKEEVIRFHDAGIDAEDVVSGRVTLLQLDGIENHGISRSISEGWL